MNRESLTDKDIVQFLEYHNRPDWLGIYHRIKEGPYPVYKLNLEEDQLWLMIADFFSTYQIENRTFSPDTEFFRTAIKKSWPEKVRRMLLRKRAKGSVLSVAFLTAIARRGSWNERISGVNFQHTGRQSTA